MKNKTLSLRTRSITVRGKKVRIYEANTRAKESVLFLHGFMSDATSIKEYIEQTGTTKRVIAPDLPGFGESECLENDDVNLEHYAGWVEDLCSVMQLEPSIVVGYSFGVYVAVQYVVASRRDIKLILVCPVVRIRWQVRLYGHGFRLMSLRNNAFAVKLYRLQHDLTTAYVRRNNHPLVRKDLYERRRNELAYLNPNLILKLFTQFLKFDLMSYASKVKNRTVIITAARDNLASNDATQLFAERVASKHLAYIDIKRAGHLLPIEEPSLLALTTANYIEEA